MPWDPVATRILTVIGHPRRRVVVEIGRPFKANPEWRCPYRIRGCGLRRSHAACGEDSMQAFQLVLVAIRAELDAAGMPLAWFGEQPGDVGIPHQAPMHLGFAVQRRVERIMARATHSENLRVIAAGKARQRKRKAGP